MALSTKDAAAVKKAAQQGLGNTPAAEQAGAKAIQAGGGVQSAAQTPQSGGYGIDAKSGQPIGPANDPLSSGKMPVQTDPTDTRKNAVEAVAIGAGVGTTPPASQALAVDAPPAPPKSKYQVGFETAKASGVQPVESAGAMRQVVAKSTPYEADTSVADAFVSDDPAMNTIMKGITSLLNPAQQTTSLMDDYKKLYKDSGLDKINHELIDADTVINGTEDDIRNEIQTAGGLATESQVQAMALSRNKSLLKRYNQLVQMKTDATNQLNTMSSLNTQDKQMAQTKVTNQINNLFQMADFRQKAQNNVKEQYRWLTQTMGVDGIYNAYKNDPRQLGFLEKTLGVASGGLKSMATEAAQTRTLDRSYKQAQIDNIYSEIRKRNDEASGKQDPSEILAYAQQYASTGTIPSGLPKGSFGIISQVAKEMPKQNGELVDRKTGVTPSKLAGDVTQGGVVALHDISKKMGQLKELYNNTNSWGIGAGPMQYEALRKEVVDAISRARSGAALTKEEAERYESAIPGSFGIRYWGNIKLNGLEDSIKGKVDTILDANGAALVGYSKVKVGGEERVVGEVLNMNGKDFRVLADGNLTDSI